MPTYLWPEAGAVGQLVWSKDAGAWQMEVAERQPFLALSAAENGSEIANCNSYSVE